MGDLGLSGRISADVNASGRCLQNVDEGGRRCVLFSQGEEGVLLLVQEGGTLERFKGDILLKAQWAT